MKFLLEVLDGDEVELIRDSIRENDRFWLTLQSEYDGEIADIEVEIEEVP